jgi:arsenite-transporting ATPase
MELEVPFVDKSDLDVFRRGNELFVRLGPYRRSFILPDALHRREVTRAKLDGGKLQVSFSDPDGRTS